MKFSEQWLREWVNPPLTTAEIVKQLTMAGLEVDSVEPVAGAFEQVVVGEVVAMQPHPDADKLRVCQVNVAAAEPLTIVCGARNVHIGMRAPTALVGARLPNDITIKATELRGVASSGMLCSAAELGLAENADGLLALPADAPIGQDLRTYLGLDDVSIEIDLTPNRGDCLGIAGVAREVGLLTRHNVTTINCNAVPAQTDVTFPVTIEAPTACARYIGRVINAINPQATTPLWMQEKLRRSGIRSISPTVDVTNYVLLELGQPMHAFDLAKLNGGIRVRMASVGEKLTLLDEQDIALDTDSLVIADHVKPLALAGVMGGLDSGVSEGTSDIFLESAFFNPIQLAGCARRYGLSTDSAYRFERGVDPQLQVKAMERATALLLDIVGGQPGPLIEVSETTHLPQKQPLQLRANRIERLLGQALPSNEVAAILARLGMQVTPQGDNWQVLPPSFRFDINIEADLIEELARVYGYDNLPSHAPHADLQMRHINDIGLHNVQACLVQRGYQEAITYSFVDPQLQAQVNPDVETLTLANPIASDMADMRTTLWTGLIHALQHNQKRQQTRVRLFETGLRFVKTAEGLQQDRMVAGIVSGTALPEQWGQANRNVDFYDLKGDVESLLALSGQSYTFKPAEHPALHPGQTAKVCQGEQVIGLCGAIHPALAQKLDLNRNIYLFELRLASLLQRELVPCQSLSKFPSLRRDIALVVDEQIPAADVLHCISTAHTDSLLTDLQLFDVYQGEGIDSGKKSLAIGLIFQSHSRNLTESDVDAVLSQVLDKLEKELNAQLRK